MSGAVTVADLCRHRDLFDRATAQVQEILGRLEVILEGTRDAQRDYHDALCALYRQGIEDDDLADRAGYAAFHYAVYQLCDFFPQVERLGAQATRRDMAAHGELTHGPGLGLW
ncbi:MAG: hypothetical protein AB7L84_14885 [Acidimicrobiia bacterium]